MSLAKRKHPLPHRDNSPKRPRSSPTCPDPLPLLQLSHHVHDLGVKVFAFREKGLHFFAHLNEQRVLPDPEETPCTAPTASKAEQEDLRLALKERLAVANETLPTLLAELAMWNTKIQLAVDVMRKGQRLPFLDDEEDEI